MVISDPSGDEGVIIFEMMSVNAPIMEIIESGIKTSVKSFHVGLFRVVGQLHPL